MTLTQALNAVQRHIEHMAVWIGKQNKGYSFEGLGEDMASVLPYFDQLKKLGPHPIALADTNKEEQNYFAQTKYGYIASITFYPGRKGWGFSAFDSTPIDHFYDMDFLPKWEPKL